MGYQAQRNTALAVVGVFGAFGFWIGESGSPPWAMVPVGSSVIGFMAVAFVSPGKLWLKTLSGLASLALYAVVFYFGSLSFSHAFNECVDRGEEVRLQLSKYFQEKNQYPDRLNQLEGFALCGCITHPTILHYERTKDGYVLSFKDWLVEHTATDSEPFMVHK